MFRTIIILICLSFSFIQQANCQFEVGIKGGYTKAWPDYGDIELPANAETDLNGFNLGILISGPIANDFGFSINPSFVQKGAACEPGWQPDFTGDSEVHLSYFELPLTINRRFTFKNFDIIPNLGYSLSYLSSASFHQEINATTTNVTDVPVGGDTPDSFNQIDHGFYSGLRIDKTLVANYFIFLDSSYFHGLKDYDKQNTSKNRNLNFSLGIGYRI